MPIHGYPGNIITANPTAPTVSAASGVWTTEQQLQAVSQGNWPGYEYPISRSLRFNSADSAYLNRTPASASNRRTWTWSGWVKRSALGTSETFFAANNGNTDSVAFEIDTNADTFRVIGFTTVYLATTPVYRDTSAWYHLVVSVDTTQATANNRIRMYVNGVEVTAFGTRNNPTQNTDLPINNTIGHQLGAVNYVSSGGLQRYFNGYLTEVNLIDGQALTPSSFGLNDPETGIWSPKQYTGTYGTNGFYLNFSDNSNTTSTTLGKDSSGNGNNWTPNNFSVTAGAGNDSLVDTPTSYGVDTGVGGEVRGNYCILNPVNPPNGVTITNGNLDFSCSNDTTPREAFATVGVKTGKWYFEGLKTNSSIRYYIGIIQSNYKPGDGISYGKLAFDTNSGTNRITMMAIDFDAGKYWTGNQGTWSSGDPSTGTGGTSFTVGSIDWVPLVGGYAESPQPSAVGSINFGQRAFSYTAPSGFKALCTQNLPTPTIGATSTTQAGKYMNVVLYTATPGTGATVSGVGFQPDLLWTKNRDNAESHYWQDAVRGFSPSSNVTKMLSSNLTSAEYSLSDITCTPTSDGFTVVDSSPGSGEFWFTNRTYVGWCWKANGAGSSNTDGTITSTVSASTTAGFSIVTYTGNNTSGTVGHGLGVKPSFFIIKKRTNSGVAYGWYCYHTTLGATKHLVLNTTAGESSSSFLFNDTEPTSSVFSVGSSDATNDGSIDYVAYCFAAVAGYSAFGSYTGNGSTDGPFVYTGFRPRWILTKRTDSTSNWLLYDTSRLGYNQANNYLLPDLSNAEGSGDNFIDILSNGFKPRVASQSINVNGATYIYAAFAESPFKYALAR